MDFNELVNLLQKARHGVPCVANLAFFLDYCVGMIDLCYFPLQTDSSKKKSTICNAAVLFRFLLNFAESSLRA